MQKVGSEAGEIKTQRRLHKRDRDSVVLYKKRQCVVAGLQRLHHRKKQSAVTQREADHQRRQNTRVRPKQKPKDQNQNIQALGVCFQIGFRAFWLFNLGLYQLHDLGIHKTLTAIRSLHVEPFAGLADLRLGSFYVFEHDQFRARLFG